MDSVDEIIKRRGELGRLAERGEPISLDEALTSMFQGTSVQIGPGARKLTVRIEPGSIMDVQITGPGHIRILDSEGNQLVPMSKKDLAIGDPLEDGWILAGIDERTNRASSLEPPDIALQKPVTFAEAEEHGQYLREQGYSNLSLPSTGVWSSMFNNLVRPGFNAAAQINNTGTVRYWGPLEGNDARFSSGKAWVCSLNGDRAHFEKIPVNSLAHVRYVHDEPGIPLRRTLDML